MGTKKAPTVVKRSELSWELLPAQLANNVWNRSAAISKYDRKPLRRISEPLDTDAKCVTLRPLPRDSTIQKHNR